MIKRVTIFIDTTDSTIDSSKWNDEFITNIINTELDEPSGFGRLKGYVIEDVGSDN